MGLDVVAVYKYTYHDRNGWYIFYSTNPDVSQDSTVYNPDIWKFEKISFFAFRESLDDRLKPVFRHRAPSNSLIKRYVYSLNPEYGRGWEFDRVAFYALETEVDGTIPVHRLRPSNAGSDEDSWRYQYITQYDSNQGTDWVRDVNNVFYVSDILVPA